jgi:hypothetical protein
MVNEAAVTTELLESGKCWSVSRKPYALT